MNYWTGKLGLGLVMIAAAILAAAAGIGSSDQREGLFAAGLAAVTIGGAHKALRRRR